MEGKSIEEFEVSEELKEKLGKAESLDEVVKILAEEGLEVTKEELEAALAQGENGELSEEALSAVSGGIIMGRAFGRAYGQVFRYISRSLII